MTSIPNISAAQQRNEIRYSYKDAPTLQAFARDDSLLRAVKGPFGSGKTVACGPIEVVRRGMRQAPPDPSKPAGGKDGRTNIARTRFAVVRNTYEELRRTTYKTFFDWLPPHLFGNWLEGKRQYTITAFRGYEIEVLFVALDRPDQVAEIKGLELTGAFINEASEVPWELIRILVGRVGRFPSAREGGCTWHGIWMDTNPPPSSSDFYQHFEVARPPGSVIYHQPSGRSPEAENLPNLRPGYYDDLAAMLAPEEVKVYVDGQYGFITTGQRVYPEYVEPAHCPGLLSVAGRRLWRGWDFGLTPACIFAEERAGGHLAVVAELCADRSDVGAFSDLVLAFSRREFPEVTGWEDIGDPAGAYPEQKDMTSVFEMLWAKGIEIREGDQDLPRRIESVRYGLRTMGDGRPMLQISERCERLREGFLGGYQHRKIAARGAFGEARFEEKPNKNRYSHPHDALQYLAVELWGGILAGVDARRPPVQTHAETPFDPLADAWQPPRRSTMIDGVPVRFEEDSDAGLQHFTVD